MVTMIDLKCAKAGNSIAEIAKDETLITKALGVLQEDGVYAFFLYLASLKKEPAGHISQKAFDLLKDDAILGNELRGQTEPMKAVLEKLADDLGRLVFVKGLLERTLVYARYHAKALDVKKEDGR
jgi:hypothetical protein